MRTLGLEAFRKRITAAFLSALALGSSLVAIPLAPPTPAGASVVTSLATTVVTQLGSRANTYECRQNPSASGCLGGLGDILRFFATESQLQHQQVMQKLQEISQQLQELQNLTQEVRAKLDQFSYDTVVRFFNPGEIEAAVQKLRDVTSTCAGATVPYSSPFCQLELGDNTPKDPGQLRIQIRSLINNGRLQSAPAEVSGNGQSGGTGILSKLPSVASELAKQRGFFTPSISAMVIDRVKYFTDLESALLLLGVNYDTWSQTPDSTIVSMIDRYRTALNEQLAMYDPMPSGITIDVSNYTMWTTDNSCIRILSQGPNCASDIEGHSVLTQCPTGDTTCKISMTLPYPSSVDADQAVRVLNSQTGPWGQTLENSYWKVPSTQELHDLFRGWPGNTNGADWLRARSTIATNSNYVWTSAVSCAVWKGSNGFKLPLPTALGGTFTPPQLIPSHVTCDRPERQMVQLKDNGQRLEGLGNCNGNGCGGVFILMHRMSEAEFSSNRWGLIKR